MSAPCVPSEPIDAAGGLAPKLKPSGPPAGRARLAVRLRRRSRSIVAALALGLLAPGLALAQASAPRSLAHAQGVTELRGDHKKVAVLSVPSLELLAALGIDAAIVPTPPAADAASQWPAGLMERYAGEGTVKLVNVGRRAAAEGPNPQVEQLRQLKPDLIISDSRTRNLYPDLQGIAPTIELAGGGTSQVDAVVQNLLLVGAVFDRDAQASAKARALLEQVRSLRDRAAGQGTGLLLFAAGERVMPQALDARFGFVYEVFGIHPALAPREGEGLSPGRPGAAIPEDADAATRARLEAERKTREAAETRYFADVMAREPDWLYVVDRNAAFGPAKAAELMAAAPVVNGSRAWQQRRVVYLDGDGASWYLSAGSLSLLERSLARIGAAFDQHRQP